MADSQAYTSKYLTLDYHAGVARAKECRYRITPSVGYEKIIGYLEWEHLNDELVVISGCYPVFPYGEITRKSGGYFC